MHGSPPSDDGGHVCIDPARLTTEATYAWIPPSDDGGHVCMVASIVRSGSIGAVHELLKP